ADDSSTPPWPTSRGAAGSAPTGPPARPGGSVDPPRRFAAGTPCSPGGRCPASPAGVGRASAAGRRRAGNITPPAADVAPGARFPPPCPPETPSPPGPAPPPGFRPAAAPRGPPAPHLAAQQPQGRAPDRTPPGGWTASVPLTAPIVSPP